MNLKITQLEEKLISLSRSPTPTPTPATKNWKLYKNTGYGFSIEYPSTFTASNTEWGVLLQRGDVRFSVNVDGGITIVFSANTNERTVVDGISAEMFVYTLPNTNDVFLVNTRLKYKGKEYNIAYDNKWNNKIEEKEIETLDQILSTFKFLPVSPTGIMLRSEP